MTQEQLLNIPIGKSVDDGEWEILRVTGGWVYSKEIYVTNDNSKAMAMTSALTSVFVPEPKPVASRFIQLTDNDGRKFCINIDQIASICPKYITGTTILYAGDNDYYDNVKESYDEVITMIQAIEAVK